ncbi:MAG: ATP-binding cassette domain-containing protein, partial [Clostridia bacterium]|nr:ATP-binding cassette domain-containing protein [Clostridia bacterium]
VYNNIAMGRKDATREMVIEAAKKARCYDFIMNLPYGFDTVLGEGGSTLSGGEIQRISIARCILKDSPIIILDEATASIDADNESLIREAMTELCKNKTTIVIAHKLHTIYNADSIVVLNKGNVEAIGAHEELIKNNETYQKLVALQDKTVVWNNNEREVG